MREDEIPKANLVKSFFDQINKIIDYRLSEVTTVMSAIVDSVNPYGTVNLHIPPSTRVYTRVKNESIYQDLKPGDSIKIIKERNKLSNMWIIGAHNGAIDSLDEAKTKIKNLEKTRISDAYPVGSVYTSTLYRKIEEGGVLTRVEPSLDPSLDEIGLWKCIGSQNFNINSDTKTVYFWERIE